MTVPKANARVLVIDDDRTFQVVANEALAAEGYEVRVARTLAAGLARLRESTYDVVLLDRRLPDGDGLTALEAMPRGPQVILASADADADLASRARRAGAAFLAKPMDLADLLAQVRAALERLS
jgi:DNA-binding response OmpR family regulator